MERHLYVPFDDILKELSMFYIQEYGAVKFKEITNKVHTSSTIQKFLVETNSKEILPLRDDIMSVIHSVFYFTFAKAEIISMGSAILLSKWHQQVAIPKRLNNNLHLNQTLFDILKKCDGFKFKLSNSETFFSKFEKKIEDKIEDEILENNQYEFTNDNVFANIAYLACENQIRIQNLKYSIGKLDCFIFYSTYISLITSYLQLSNTDNVDIYLMEGINLYCDSLGLEKDSFYFDFDFEEYVKRRSNLFMEFIQEIDYVNFDTNLNIPYYIGYFEADGFIEMEEIELLNINNLSTYFEAIKNNLELINYNYKKINRQAHKYSINEWVEPNISFIKNAKDFIKSLAVYPFEEYRCNICGDLVSREKLKRLPIHDSDEGYSLFLPVCKECEVKHIKPNGWIEF